MTALRMAFAFHCSAVFLYAKIEESGHGTVHPDFAFCQRCAKQKRLLLTLDAEVPAAWQ
jgi:hypothetical protein